MTQTQRCFWFFLFVIVNVIVKGIYCAYTPYSYDEIISVKDTLLDFGHIKHESEWDNNPPFFYYCLWVWHKLVPISEFNSRLLSVLFVAFSIGLFFLFSQKHFGSKAAIGTAVLLSLSNFITYYSQETRTYALVLLLSVISSILLFNFLAGKKKSTLFLLALVNFLLIYSHYITALFLGVQYVVVLAYYRSDFRRFAIINTLVIVGLVLLRFTKKQFLNILNHNKKGDFWLQPATYSDLWKALTDLMFHPVLVILFFVSIVMYFAKYKSRSAGDKFPIEVYCLLIGFGTVLVLFGVGVFKSVFLARYLIFSVPFATLFFVNTISGYHRAGIFLVIPLAIFLAFGMRIRKESGMDYRSMAEIIKRNKGVDDKVIVNTRDNILLFEYYYDKSSFLKYKNMDSVCKSQNIFGINDTEQLMMLELETSPRIFLVQSFHMLSSPKNDVADFLANRMSFVYKTEAVKGVELRIFRSK